MTSNHWQVLGIEPTTNPDNIRHAYASRVKRVNPEDDPSGFQRLRHAYELAMDHAQAGETASPSQTRTGTFGTLPPLVPGPESAFADFCKHLKQGHKSFALANLAEWWFDPALTDLARRRFNRLLLDYVLDNGIPQGFLAQMAWQIYWPSESLEFPVEASPARQYAFRQRILQAIQFSIWDIRQAFASYLAKGEAEAGIAHLQNQLASPDFDHLAKRHMLRVSMLRYVAGNNHITPETLLALEDLFHFSKFSQSYSRNDLNKAQTLHTRLKHIDATKS